MASEGLIILSYHDTLLRESDVNLLNGPHWLNDNLIAFWFQYLENDLYHENAERVVFVSPQVAQLIKMGGAEDLRSTFQSWDLSKIELIFFPINDCSTLETPGGTHWSLLVFRPNYCIFEHYDSHTGSVNRYHAECVARILTPYLVGTGSSPPEVEAIEMECTQQQNGYDCGLHVICNTEALCRKQFTDNQKHISDIASTQSVQRARNDLRSIIYSLKRKK